MFRFDNLHIYEAAYVHIYLHIYIDIVLGLKNKKGFYDYEGFEREIFGRRLKEKVDIK